MKSRNKAIVLVSVILILLVGCATKDNISGGVVADFSDKVEVLNMSGDMSCAGTKVEPCTAEITFKVLENFVAEPKKMIQISKPEAVRIVTHEGSHTFQTKYHYNLKYEVYKQNPTDELSWSWGPIK